MFAFMRNQRLLSAQTFSCSSLWFHDFAKLNEVMICGVECSFNSTLFTLTLVVFLGPEGLIQQSSMLSTKGIHLTDVLALANENFAAIY